MAHWFRNHLESRFHVARLDGKRFVTLCQGSWSISDKTDSSPSPPHELRCGRCQELAIEAARVERGLVELSGGEG